MRSVLAGAMLAALAGCGLDSGDDDWPVRPGGGGNGGGMLGPDAREPDATTAVLGRVCVVQDLRDWTAGCANTGVADLTVTIGSATATTSDNGSFTITPPAATGLRVLVEGTGIVRSDNPYDPTAALIEAVAPTEAHWIAVQQGTAFAATTGLGHALVETRVDGAPSAGVEVGSAPGSATGVFYDGATAAIWLPGTTGVAAKAIVPNLQPGAVTVSALAPDLVSLGATDVTILADTLTFDRVDIATTP